MSQRRCDCGSMEFEAKVEMSSRAWFEDGRMVVSQDVDDESLASLECVACGRVYPYPTEHAPLLLPGWDWSKWFVNVYLTDRAYGGSEEGGWWYDCGQIVRSVECETKQEANQKAEEMREEYSNEGRPEIDSVLSEGRYDVRVEDRPGKDYPSQRPHYE